MSRTRIYQAIPLKINSTLQLDTYASHHIAQVLRAAVGDTLILFNGEGGEYVATITHIHKKTVTVEINSFSPQEVESPIPIYLAQGIARGEKMDFIVQKAVELGVTSIFPLITERCNVRLDNEREKKRLQHWQSIIVSACEQSGRNRIPQLYPPQKLTAWLLHMQMNSTNLGFVLSPYTQNKLPAKSSSLISVSLLIGPEGGLTDNEIALAEQHHFLPLNLGPRILRTETATVAALSTLQWWYGDL